MTVTTSRQVEVCVGTLVHTAGIEGVIQEKKKKRKQKRERKKKDEKNPPSHYSCFTLRFPILHSLHNFISDSWLPLIYLGILLYYTIHSSTYIQRKTVLFAQATKHLQVRVVRRRLWCAGTNFNRAHVPRYIVLKYPSTLPWLFPGCPGGCLTA